MGETAARPAEVKALRPGWKTTEFWLSLGGLIYPLIDSSVPASVKAGAAVFATGIYALARGLAKLGIGR